MVFEFGRGRGGVAQELADSYPLDLVRIKAYVLAPIQFIHRIFEGVIPGVGHVDIVILFMWVLVVL